MRPETRRPSTLSPRGAILLLLAAIVLWGCLDALGAYWFNHDLRRAAVVLVAVGGFAGLWALLLVTGHRPGKRPPRGDAEP